MAKRVNIVVEQYSNFEYTFNINGSNNEPYNLSGYIANSAFKKYPESDTTYIFTSSISGSNITITMSSSQTSNLVPGTYLYDVKITDGANVSSRPIEGLVTVTPGIAR